MTTWDAFYGPNAGYALELYERYRQDHTAVDEATRSFFATATVPEDLRDLLDGQGTAPSAEILQRQGAVVASGLGNATLTDETIWRVVVAARLARGIREYGHLAARIDPLGSQPPGDPMLEMETHGINEDDLAAMPASIVWRDATAEAGTCLDAIERLRAIYCGSLGYDFDHVQDFGERAWLMETIESGSFRQPLPPEQQRELLQRLTEVEGFEQFLHTTFQGQKRFSIEGTDMLVPMLDEVIHDAALVGAREALIGMAHRGRLNVLAHILDKPYTAIFSEFHSAPNKELVPSEGSMGINYGWTGDVKYHLGGHATLDEEGTGAQARVQVTLADNPSHLEFVNPVIEGFTRAAQDHRDAPGAPTQEADAALAVAIHGDAAFPGEGVVAETLNLSRLAGYQTGGTVHIIANNQLGFTTEALEGRSTLYASDLAKGFEIPIVHVNADDPEACLAAIRLAHAYRQRFHKDFLVDLVGYRRWGHNEGDEPAFTQPQLYARIAKHPTVRTLYAEALASHGVVTLDEAKAMSDEVRTRLRAAYAALNTDYSPKEQAPLTESPTLASASTAVRAEELREINAALLERPEGFAANSRLERLLERRRERLEAAGGIEWAHAESLAFAAILADGTPIRMSGQDSERGTFSQRHLVLHDVNTGARYTPLQHLPQAQASFAVFNSPLSEAAVLGFEYGYSVHAPETLTLWEAQFGDFANAGQVVIDQFIAAARAKWRQHPGLVLLLPHGYEGQGPEHSSGRLERYLTLAAEDNLRIVNATTAAQYFHLLRAQAALLKKGPRPLVVMTPKSLLRHPMAGSSLRDLTEGHFQPVLVDAETNSRRKTIQRIVLCSGKVYVDVMAGLNAQEQRPERLVVARIEQLYPFPEQELSSAFARYPKLREVVWLQEEPQNMGAWRYIAPRLQATLPNGVTLQYVGRPERASTAEGSADFHAAEQARIVGEALAGERVAHIESREEQHVG